MHHIFQICQGRILVILRVLAQRNVVLWVYKLQMTSKSLLLQGRVPILFSSFSPFSFLSFYGCLRKIYANLKIEIFLCFIYSRLFVNFLPQNPIFFLFPQYFYITPRYCYIFFLNFVNFSLSSPPLQGSFSQIYVVSVRKDSRFQASKKEGLSPSFTALPQSPARLREARLSSADCLR